MACSSGNIVLYAPTTSQLLHAGAGVNDEERKNTEWEGRSPDRVRKSDYTTYKTVREKVCEKSIPCQRKT